MPNGLYYHDTHSYSDQLDDQLQNLSFVNTVENNQNLYTRRQVTGTDDVVAFNKEIGYLCPQRLVKILEQSYFRNFFLTGDDTKRAIDIYGPDRECLKGTTTRVTPQHVPAPINIPLQSPYVIVTRMCLYVQTSTLYKGSLSFIR